jgi:hypothetical protein
MAKRNWKRATPRSLRHGMELCLGFAKERKNLNVDRIADLMGVSSKWTLYKWLENASMPVKLVAPFENACGCHFMTQYQATSAHKLLIDIPSSKPAKEEDLLALQTGFNEAVNVLASFYKGTEEASVTLAELTRHMTEIAAHRARVEKVAEPELELFGSEA